MAAEKPGPRGKLDDRQRNAQRARQHHRPGHPAHAGAQRALARVVPERATGLQSAVSDQPLTYRIQELAYGGLSPATTARLEAIASVERYIDREMAKKRIQDRPVAGTRLIREWQGTDHAVTVLEDGFEYLGRPYKSLSAVANAITGTRWSGPLFFGLRAQGGNS
ncbi:hypothetical protein WCLP8_2650002 [uncultured Gammaproteobacteria bacterium]